MKFFRKIPRLWRILLFLAAIVAILWRSPGNPTQTDLFGTRIALVLRAAGSNFDRMRPDDPGDNTFLESSLFQTSLRDFSDLDALFAHNLSLKKTLQQDPLWIGFSLGAADSLHGLWILKAPESNLYKTLTTDNPAIRRVTPHETKGFHSFEVRLTNGHTWTLASKGDFLLLSPLAHLAEDALTDAQESGLWRSGLFRRHSGGLKSDWALFADPAALHPRMLKVLGEPWKRPASYLAENVELLAIYFGNGGADWFVFPKKEMSNWLKNTTTGSVPEDTERILPAQLAFSGRIALRNEKAMLQVFDAGDHPDFQRYITPWITPCVTWGILDPVAPGLVDRSIIAAPIRDSAEAKERLEACGRQYGYLKRYDYQTFRISQWAKGDCLAPLSRAFGVFRNPAYVQIENHIVFSASPKTLELVIDQYIVGQTLGNDPEYLLLKSKHRGEGGLELFLNTQTLPAIAEQIFTPDWGLQSTRDFEGIAGAGLLTARLAEITNEFLHFPVSSQRKTSRARQAPGVLWKTGLDAPVASGPFVVKTGKGAARILVQDAFNHLYCLQADDGALLWRHKLPGRIHSGVSAIDIYRNNKIAYLASTPDAILLIDEAGKMLEGFPLRLQTPASNGVVAVDFDGARQYSFFIACENGNLYGFDPVGKPLPGWNPRNGVGETRHPIGHLQHAGKDYLLALNTAGKLFVFGRNGDLHFDPVSFEGRFRVAPYAGLENNTPRFVCFNDAGTAWVCNAAGKAFSTSLLKSTSTPVFGVGTPVSAGPSYDLAAAAGKTLVLKKYSGEQGQEVFRVELPIRADTLFSAGKGLGVLDRRRRNILFVDTRGKNTPLYPLEGSTPFVVVESREDRSFLVVGSGSEVCAFQISQ